MLADGTLLTCKHIMADIQEQGMVIDQQFRLKGKQSAIIKQIRREERWRYEGSD